MYPVSGLSNTAPIMDDGGIVQPQDSEAAGIAVKNKNIEEYKNATASPKEEKSTYVPSDADKINPNAKYGDNPGEKRIDVSSYLKPLGTPKMAPMYDDGGPVKDDPTDGPITSCARRRRASTYSRAEPSV